MADDEITSRPGVRVHAQSIIKGLHERYGRQIGMLVQENAEITAALDVTRDELEELQSKWRAVMGDPGADTVEGPGEQHP